MIYRLRLSSPIIFYDQVKSSSLLVQAKGPILALAIATAQLHLCTDTTRDLAKIIELSFPLSKALRK